ncbi:hypothetical protein F5B22DRAFT_606822 [Xylaria bambusicola]|uniref:uncharacterized protein n=1 Tax=Xylaria bambusicola TaxID=326684 RepID=UPI002008A90E|nr:uncharacterized protein F5B22DRAFT_606822 [Xylaria bambusicola]KAI0516871.1 hypothetical protein F5B22DRAFT_606822 [Xylaria bambusicola]
MMAPSNSSSLRNVQDIKQFSDVMLICEGEIFNAHKATICLVSPVMAAALTGNFNEAKINQIVVSFDLPSVKRLIDFMYTGDYDLSTYTASDILSAGHMVEQASSTEEAGKEIGNLTSNQCEKLLLTVSLVLLLENLTISNGDESDTTRPNTIHDQLTSHARMNAIADYYAIPALATLSTANFRRVLEDEWSAKDFCGFLRGSKGMMGDAQFKKMLGAMTMRHLEEVAENHLLDDEDVVRELSPYLLPELYCLLKSTKELLEDSTKRAKGLEDNQAQCVSLLSRWSSCRHCPAKFHCFLEKEYQIPSSGLLLRCSKCRTRHQ